MGSPASHAFQLQLKRRRNGFLGENQSMQQKGATMNVLRVAITTSLLLLSSMLFGMAALAEGTIKASLRALAPPELPIAVAKLIEKSSASDRKTTTLLAVQAAVELNPAAAPLIVGAIARAVPEMAAIAAATAAEKEPAQVDAITKAAVAIVPRKSGEIVASICAAVPNEFLRIALAAEETAPSSRQEIIKSIGVSLPTLKPYLEREVALYGRGAPPLALALERATLAHSQAMRTNALSELAPRIVSENLPASQTSESPPSNAPKGGDNGHHGGRNYAKP